jgi:hypothetical protein
LEMASANNVPFAVDGERYINVCFKY